MGSNFVKNFLKNRLTKPAGGGIMENSPRVGHFGALRGATKNRCYFINKKNGD